MNQSIAPHTLHFDKIGHSAEGYLAIADRAKDVIKSGGEWISSVDLENAIMAIPGVAEAAVIAWLRHQTTGYDSMRIPRVKGKRREVRRMLAQRSNELLASYRRGEGEKGESGCLLSRALDCAAGTDK